MGGDHDGLAGLDLGDDGALPVGQEALEDVLEALGGGDGLTGVAGVGVLGELGAGLDGRRRHVVGAAPLHELLLPVLVADLLLVLALQGAVVALVEAPVSLHRDPVAVGGVQGEVGGHDGAAQHRGEELLGEDTGLLEKLAAVDGLGAALV